MMIKILYSNNYQDVKLACKQVKTGDMSFLNNPDVHMAITKALPEKCILIPVPGHEGKATYTKSMVNTIVRFASEDMPHKIIITADVLTGNRHDSLCERKQKGLPIEDIDIAFSCEEQSKKIIMDCTEKGWTPVFVDNVIDTGKTLRAAMNTLGNYPVIVLGDTGAWNIY